MNGAKFISKSPNKKYFKSNINLYLPMKISCSSLNL